MRIRRISISAVLIIILLVVSVVLRISNLLDHTEFLGDQGRTFLHVYTAWNEKTVPTVGPTVISGQYLGPAYYFLIAPFLIATRFQLVSGAYAIIFYGVLGIVFSFCAFNILFSASIALLLSAIWALSPFTISSDRVLWEPNLVPTFVMLFILATAMLLRTQKKVLGSILMGTSTGILIQLHYPNLLFILLSCLVLIMTNLHTKIGSVSRGKLCFVYACAFFIVCSPFIYHELTHGFENSAGVIKNFIHPVGDPIRKKQIVANFIDFAGRVVGKISPQSRGTPIGAIIIILSVMVWFGIYRTDLSFLLFIWVFVGVGALSVYRGIVHEHYLYFLVPAAYVVLGHWLTVFTKNRRFVPFVYCALGIILVCNLYKSIALVYVSPEQKDILRLEKTVQIVKNELGSQAFGFGLVRSPSFSDLHYRASFILHGLNVGKITGLDSHIVLVCETNTCPFDDIYGTVQTLCNEDHCQGTYPVVSLSAYNIHVIKTDDVMVLFGVQ